MVLESGDLLPLDAAGLKLFLDLACVANTREEVRLSTSVAIKRRKPLVPLFLISLCLLKVANDREFKRREESIVCNGVILPTVFRSSHIVRWLFVERGTLFEIQLGSLDILSDTRHTQEDE